MASYKGQRGFALPLPQGPGKPMTYPKGFDGKAQPMQAIGKAQTHDWGRGPTTTTSWANYTGTSGTGKSYTDNDGYTFTDFGKNNYAGKGKDNS